MPPSIISLVLLASDPFLRVEIEILTKKPIFEVWE